MRRSRVKLHYNALLTASGLAGFLMVLTFFFYDGPLRPPVLMSTAMATEDPFEESFFPSATDENAHLSFAGLNGQAEWVQVGLDRNRVRLNVLKAPLTLAQTAQKSGSEAFDYAAYLYSQMAQEIQDSELSARLNRLSMEAQALGQSLRQASQIRFDGPPAEDMGHLQVRAAIISHLSVLNRDALLMARYNQQGVLLHQDQARFKAGEGLNHYLSTLKQIKSLPAVRQYPETLALITRESELLGQIAKNLTLRWESTMQCPSHCDDMATFMSIYLHQSLPDETLVSARI